MKFVIGSLEEVAEPLRGEYEARAGKFHLKTEGDFAPLAESNARLAEFRDNNRSLNSAVTDLTTKLKGFDGVDALEYKALKTKITDLEQGGIKDKNDVAEIIKAAVKAAVSPLEVKLLERETSERAAQEALARTGLENKLREVGSKVGIDERALPDYVNRGLQVFRLVDGKPAARDGDKPIFSKERPAEELSMDEWAGGLFSDAPFLFKTSGGGGAHQNGRPLPAQGQRRVIQADAREFGLNLEAIAKGDVLVQQ